MHRTLDNRRFSVVVAALFAMGATLATAVAASAQDNDPYKVLVPFFINESGGKANFGKDVSEEVQKALERMATHQPVDKKDLKDALKKYDLKEDQLGLNDCTLARQLAAQNNIQLVLCGSFTEASGGNMVKAAIISPTTQEAFNIDAFQATDAKQAAQHIVTSFEQYAQGLKQQVFCQGYIDSQQWNEALAACDKALELAPNSKGALYSRANALWKLERREEALEGFKKILAIDPIHQNALLASALVTSELNQKDEALKYFKEYLALDPGNTQVRLQIALDAAKAGNNEAALAIVEEGMKGDTSDAQLIEYAGAFAMNAANAQMAGGGDPSPEAIALMNKALGFYEKVFQAKGAETDPSIVRNMLLAYRTLDRTNEALAFGAKAVAATPNDAALWSAYADALGKAGKTNEALAALDKAVAIDADYAVNARRGLWLLSAGKLTEAKAALARALEKNELDPSQVDQVAKQIAATGFNDRDKKGQHQQAIEFYEAARDLAKTPETKGMISFFHGYAIYQIAADRAKTQTVDAAKATLPMFERVVDFMQAAVPFTSSGTGAQSEGSRKQILDRAKEQIEIQQLIIKKGR